MKNVTELHFYSSDNQTISKVMYNERFREAYELFPDTPTMVICDAPKQYCWHSSAYDPQSIALCYACGRFFITQTELLSWKRLKELHCPNCGRVHPIRNVRKVSDQNAAIPTYIIAKIFNCKDKVKLCLAYSAQILGHNPVKDRDYKQDIYEEFCFYTEENRTTWTNFNGITYEIGYANDCEFFVEKSALNFLNWSTKSQEGCTFSFLLKELKRIINKKMKALGRQPKSMSIRGAHKTLVIDSICVIAHQVRFWDSMPIDYYGQRISHYGWDEKPIRESYVRWCVQNQIKEPYEFEQNIDRISRTEKISYMDAFCKYFNLDIPNFAKKYIRYKNISFLKLFYKEYGVQVGNAYIPFVYDQSYTTLAHFYSFFKTFHKLYPNVPANRIASYGCTKEAYDTYSCYIALNNISKQAILDNLPKFKDLHDTVSLKLAEQEDPNRGFVFADGMLEKLSRTLNNYRFDVLRNSNACKEIGKKLSNCAGGYGKKTTMGSTLFLVSVYKDNNLYALLELTDKSLVQAKLYANKVVSSDLEANSVVVEYTKTCGLTIETRDVKPELDTLQVQTA